MTISIAPYTIGSPNSPKIGTTFSVRYINYSAPTAVADCVLLDAAGAEVSAQLVNATEAQTDAWTDDASFYAVLAENAGLTPV